jgi:hypothetical protein
MQEKRRRGKLYGLWLTIMIFISGRASVWPLLHGHRTVQDIAICGVMVLVYLLGYAGGSRSIAGSSQGPPGLPGGPAEDPST